MALGKIYQGMLLYFTQIKILACLYLFGNLVYLLRRRNEPDEDDLVRLRFDLGL